MNTRLAIQFDLTAQGCFVKSVETDDGEEITLCTEAETLELLEPVSRASRERHWVFG